MNYNEILARRIVAEVAHIGRQQGMQPVMLHGHAGPTSDDGVIKRNSLRKTGGGSLTSSDDFDHHCVCSACLASYPLPEDRSVPIQTNFHFNQIRDQANAQRMALSTQDLLGPLRSFIGVNHIRTWSGPGFNMIWRPHNKQAPNTQDFFLELDVTKETLSFTDITGPQGIANRGFLQGDIALGGLAYLQEVSDVTRVPPKALHFEPGVWACVPSTSSRAEPQTVVRMGSIPHGTTINAEGTGFDSQTGRPAFSASSIKPFTIGSPDDGVTGIVEFNESTQPLSADFPSRTNINDLVGVTDAHFQNPTLILSDVVASQEILKTKVFIITTDVTTPSTDQAPNLGNPQEGGGTDNIAFLVGSAGGPNAKASRMTATFWVETIKGDDGKVFEQLQYIQRVLLDFNGLSWPHVSVATMVVISES
jgi:hypothetical protein